MVKGWWEGRGKGVGKWWVGIGGEGAGKGLLGKRFGVGRDLGFKGSLGVGSFLEKVRSSLDNSQLNYYTG